jgi:hypothetical protein
MCFRNNPTAACPETRTQMVVGFVRHGIRKVRLRGATMRTCAIAIVLTAGVLVYWAGCQAPSSRGPADEGQQQPARRASLTAQNNPTTLAGRGEPSLEDTFRPAAWIFIDGREGAFLERDGNPQVQWFIEDPVGSSPTFRVEAYEPVLGVPRDFNCILDTVESADGSKIEYAFSAEEGTFRVGYEYSLLNPGENFTVRNRTTGDVVAEIPPLAPGTYLLAAGVKNLGTGKEGLAITYFTVGEGR